MSLMFRVCQGLRGGGFLDVLYNEQVGGLARIRGQVPESPLSLCSRPRLCVTQM